MNYIEGENINEIQLSLYRLISDKGSFVKVRGNYTKEIFPVSIELNNPLGRITTISERNWNMPFAIGELCWHFSGSNSFDFINYYSKNWGIAVNEGEQTIRESCYGNTIFGGQNCLWSRLVYELSEDNNSRRAVISLYDANSSLGLDKKDVACTSTIQFLIRNNRLDCIVTMRSNDIVWGLPNDIFIFTMLQERLALRLGVKLGKYYHNVGSMHIYDRHYEMMESILSNPTFFELTMKEMKSISSINKFLYAESLIRAGESFNYTDCSYWNELLNVLVLRSQFISNENKEKIISNSTYSELIKLCPSDYIFN